MFDVKINFNSSFYKKTDASLYQDALKESIEYMTNAFVDECKKEAPVRTGRLRDGHYSRVQGLTGIIGNNVDYAPYVIFGTSRQAPNNYPSRVASRMGLMGQYQSIFQQSLITKGIL